ESKDAARRDQYIEALDAERCSYFTTDIFLGLNADAVMKNFGPWVKHGFDAVALSVKQRAEALYAASGK
ncbi:MAG: SRPBCC domain-containing protein, partial [Noviherbaspirillum sp.]